jgi:hypothetical protein
MIRKETRHKIWVQHRLVGGIPTPLKNMKVSWDDDISNIWKNKSHVPNHQPAERSEASKISDVHGILPENILVNIRWWASATCHSVSHQ